MESFWTRAGVWASLQSAKDQHSISDHSAMTIRQRAAPTSKASFPFSAVVGQEEMKRALLIAAIDPTIGGVLAFGDRGTGKTTAIRSLAGLLPKRERIAGCRFACVPEAPAGVCDLCAESEDRRSFKVAKEPVPVVELPLGATEDRVVGALDLERALTRGEKAFEPGLLAQAHLGFLYVDEINLLEDHIVDLLLDVCASGENVVEREGLSVRHPARFVLIGSGNPEEGELRPQLLDRFGLSVEIRTPDRLDVRVDIVRRRDEYERDPTGFAQKWKRRDGTVRRRILEAQAAVHDTEVPDAVVSKAAELCMALGTDGLRGELTLVRAARALAAYDGQPAVTVNQVRLVAPAALGHRLRRDPLDEAGSGARVERALSEVLG